MHNQFLRHLLGGGGSGWRQLPEWRRCCARWPCCALQSMAGVLARPPRLYLHLSPCNLATHFQVRESNLAGVACATSGLGTCPLHLHDMISRVRLVCRPLRTRTWCPATSQAMMKFHAAALVAVLLIAQGCRWGCQPQGAAGLMHPANLTAHPNSIQPPLLSSSLKAV